jgi:hypothetical protein
MKKRRPRMDPWGVFQVAAIAAVLLFFLLWN